MSRLLSGPDERRELTAAERVRQVEGKLAISALSVSLRSSCSPFAGILAQDPTRSEKAGRETVWPVRASFYLPLPPL